MDGDRDGDGRDALQCVSTNKRPTNGQTKNKFGPQRKNIGSIIGGFKSTVTKQARLILPEFGWQARFHDHIIRNEMGYERIAHYIKSNPGNWNEDGFFTEK